MARMSVSQWYSGAPTRRFMLGESLVSALRVRRIAEAEGI